MIYMDDIIYDETYQSEHQGFHGNTRVDWSGLPGLGLSLVTDKLNHLTAFTRFGAVCSSWRAVYKDNRDRIPRDPLLLLLPDQNNKDGQTRILYSFNEKRVYKNFKLSVPHNEFCPGSSHGWLAMVSDDYQVRLINPFLSENNEIKLPPLTAFERPEHERLHSVRYLRKVVLSADPISNPNYIVMALHGEFNRLSFYKSGDKSWTSLGGEMICMDDIIYDDHKFYALKYTPGKIFSCDLNGPSPVVSVKSPGHNLYDSKNYLVKSGSDLLQVTRDIEEDDYNNYYTCGFTVLKLDSVKGEWSEVKTLDGQILFLGDNSSLSLSTADMPGCKPNHIYFTDDNHAAYFQDGVEPHDMGVFSLEDGSIQFFNMEDGSIQFFNLDDDGIQRVKSVMIGPASIMIEPSPSRILS